MEVNKKMKKNILCGLSFSFFAILILLSGCTTMSSGTYGKGSVAEKPLEVSSVLRFNDIPAPYGFKILDHESFAFQNDATRVALLKYVGGTVADRVVLFYKEQMPLYNWNPINIIEYERRVMNFENDSESCIITIEAKGRSSIVTIAISPKSQPMEVETKK